MIDTDYLNLGKTALAASLAASLAVVGYGSFMYFGSQYFNWRDRLATLESRAIAQAEWRTETTAAITNKDMGFFANGYKLTIKDKDRQLDLFVTPEEYLAAQIGQETCVRYKLWNGKVKGAHLCQSTTGGK